MSNYPSTGVTKFAYVLNQSPENPIVFGESLVRELKEIFSRCDRSSNGLLAPGEFKSALGDYGIGFTDRILEGLIQRFDQNQKGSLNFTEFCNMFLALLSSNGLKAGGFFFK